ncbi:MAG: hypothetical protein NTZ68_03020 [Candidatus Dependentiae bacterium]|nr:hypothetical protein [Candidatus Dependentiae bacterium]
MKKLFLSLALFGGFAVAGPEVKLTQEQEEQWNQLYAKFMRFGKCKSLIFAAADLNSQELNPDHKLHDIMDPSQKAACSRWIQEESRIFKCSQLGEVFQLEKYIFSDESSCIKLLSTMTAFAIEEEKNVKKMKQFCMKFGMSEEEGISLLNAQIEKEIKAQIARAQELFKDPELVNDLFGLKDDSAQ